MKKVAIFYKYKMMMKIGSIFPNVLVELDDVTKVFNEHTNLSSKLREIGKSQFVEKLQETCKLPSLECEQQNLARTFDRFLKLHVHPYSYCKLVFKSCFLIFP
jgi:hypothetical protein